MCWRHKIKKKKYYILSAIVILIVFLTCYIKREHNPLPPASVIGKIKFNYRHQYDGVEYEGVLPREKYGEFIRLFDDAVYIFRNRVEYQIPGSCIIKKKDGKEDEIVIYGSGYLSKEKTLISFLGNYYMVASDKKFYNFFKKNNQKSLQQKNALNSDSAVAKPE